jgi:hypothetical protein
LLRTGRHAGRGADALDVEHYRRHFGVVGEPDEFVHQGNARAARRREGARAIPRSADHGADRRELVFALHDHVIALAGFRIDSMLLTEALERIHQ